MPCESNAVPGEPDERRATTGAGAAAEDDAVAAGDAGTREDDVDGVAGDRSEGATVGTGSTSRVVVDGRPWKRILDAGMHSASVRKVDPASGVPTH